MGEGTSSRPETEHDIEARARAAERAGARQEQFEKTTVGKNAYGQVKDMKMQRTQVTTSSAVDAKDWVN